MIVDIIALVVLVLLLIIAWRKGLLAMVAGLASSILAFLAAKMLAPKLSLIFLPWIQKSKAMQDVSIYLNNLFNSGAKAASRGLFGIGLPRGKAEELAMSNTLSTEASKYLSQWAASALSFILLFILISALIYFLIAKFTQILDKVPVIGTVNRLSGLLLALVIWFILLLVFSYVSSYLAPLIPSLRILNQSSSLIKFIRSGGLLSSLLDIIS